MGIVEDLKKRKVEEEAEAAAKAKETDEAIKTAEAKDAKVASITKKAGDKGKALVSAKEKEDEVTADLELAKETARMAHTKTTEAVNELVNMEVVTEEKDTSGALVMEPMFNTGDIEVIMEVYEAKATKATKATKKGNGGNGGKKMEVMDAIKGGNNTKKGLDAVFGDSHSQTYQLGQDGLIVSDGKGTYSVV